MAPLGAGCRPNRRTVQAIQRAGFDLVELDTFNAWPNVPVTNPVARGVATPR